MLAPGRCIASRHRLVRLLGRGGMGEVWQVHNEAVERDFAMKILSAECAEDDTLAKRLLREGRAAGRLRHPNIIEIFDAATDPEVGPYLVMELLDGCTLADVLKTRRALPLETTLTIGVTVARALHAAHEAGVIHRDLKAANVFVHQAHDGAVILKLVDFGISKVRAVKDEQVTVEGTVLGSPLAMSPEQAVGRVDVDRRTDVWSLGVLLYRMVAGRNPFRGASPGALLKSIVVDDPVPVRELAPDAPRELTELIDRCLQKEPGERPATAAEVERSLAKLGRTDDDLRSLIGEADDTIVDSAHESSLTTETPAMLPAAPMTASELAEATEPSAPPVRRRGGMLWIACGAALLVLVSVAAAVSRKPEPVPVAAAPAASPVAIASVAPSIEPPPAASQSVAPPQLIVKRPKSVVPIAPAPPKPLTTSKVEPTVKAAHEGVKHADF